MSTRGVTIQVILDQWKDGVALFHESVFNFFQFSFFLVFFSFCSCSCSDGGIMENMYVRPDGCWWRTAKIKRKLWSFCSLEHHDGIGIQTTAPSTKLQPTLSALLSKSTSIQSRLPPLESGSQLSDGLLPLLENFFPHNSHPQRLACLDQPIDADSVVGHVVVDVGVNLSR
jgi:hypothetical protein